jgi:glycosyltransferase involved in cell wall biosynthesis
MPINAPDAESGLCSIILPTYNRAAFLPDAIASIQAQRYEHWELIVVDDGSTDDTRARCAELTQGLRQPTRYVYQPNRGPDGARNRGVELARGEYIAFYDNDDLWLPHHLSDCIAALRAHPQLTWVYGACRRVDVRTQQTTEPNSFYADGRPRPFLGLRTQPAGALKIIDDAHACRWAIADGLYNGLQASVLRRRLFDDGLRLADLLVASDRCFAIQALKRGARLGYFDDVHVIYRIHAGNTCCPGGGDYPLERRMSVQRGVIAAYEYLQMHERFAADERRALRHRIARERFWNLGYNLFWQHGRRAEALQEYHRALRIWPWNPRMWKTLVLAYVKLAGQRDSRLV